MENLHPLVKYRVYDPELNHLDSIQQHIHTLANSLQYLAFIRWWQGPYINVLYKHGWIQHQARKGVILLLLIL